MFTSRIARSVGTAGAGNRLMKEAGEISEKTMLFGAGGLAGLTGLAYWAGYHAEGKSKAGRENGMSVCFS
ncbi:hypothetical protein GALMADRAFT_242603 [Galerina marginata CBS 339.88]|uniref:Uncharacterized protein n=1 Tax=Galerina marginata (strain CBS 339.88) TaxID=685588 RepID=A0A067TD37_GALM3|nr:hypothetical protein GALMADRAFT_242603 [Galerina marginata CBS 339.88]